MLAIVGFWREPSSLAAKSVYAFVVVLLVVQLGGLASGARLGREHCLHGALTMIIVIVGPCSYLYLLTYH